MLPSLWNMQTYCLRSRKHTDSIGSKKVIMALKYSENDQNVLKTKV